MKFCKDCKYYKYSIVGDAYANCVSPAVPVDLVSGRKKLAFADLERTYPDDCGKEAKYFEQREPLWQRVKQLMKIS